ncbi:MAG: HD domain-containing protein [Candidatus Liptonbacteria bacterium]|nr:HD domain-containing protein [Candidatus Liptonbacteria bacterium]
MNEEKLLLWLFERCKIKENNRASILVYLSLLGQRSEETRRHCIRVGHLASEIGNRCEIEEIKPKVLAWAGLLHDPGKALVDPDLLERKEKFTAADYERMKLHVEY